MYKYVRVLIMVLCFCQTSNAESEIPVDIYSIPSFSEKILRSAITDIPSVITDIPSVITDKDKINIPVYASIEEQEEFLNKTLERTIVYAKSLQDAFEKQKQAIIDDDIEEYLRLSFVIDKIRRGFSSFTDFTDYRLAYITKRGIIKKHPEWLNHFEEKLNYIWPEDWKIELIETRIIVKQ